MGFRSVFGHELGDVIEAEQQHEVLCKAFEEYVLGMFPDEFVIERPDADGDIVPDFLVTDTVSGKRFAVVCVFQPVFHTPEKGDCDVVECGTFEQVRAYKQFAHFERMPLFLIVGVGGLPDDPDQVFSIPVEEIGCSELPREACAGYERASAGLFAFCDGCLR
ncbi:hypothetical protein [Methanocorpusculum vombati]|uniref:Uncharacterized protein n=1 Tax=Methanocorpusculum vombati TaxID=3002864 RepID=A0ABT4IMZ1_9EURY|nr:hypothetical protein [Methanocorpusculum vombati]MCZ9319744.1 hypothetical protein [Methanocorpusculum sp.]MCZ0863129.1 hypothetical protein [Methanocorpusculum vombati]MDE2519847.1 hypothetical protein [Methanocorpusculum sp.]MDE2534041.1 hypothetical protein [Methanocorpusculum sp.]MDE2546191.1 hypothetical protein [Methanocorpusculum sp.]